VGSLRAAASTTAISTPAYLLLWNAISWNQLELIQAQLAQTEASAAKALALRKQSKYRMIQEGEGHWPNSSKNLQVTGSSTLISLLKHPAPRLICKSIRPRAC